MGKVRFADGPAAVHALGSTIFLANTIFLYQHLYALDSAPSCCVMMASTQSCMLSFSHGQMQDVQCVHLWLGDARQSSWH